MMIRSQPLSRRTVLRGLGSAFALPWLEAMGPAPEAAAAVLNKAAQGVNTTSPTRMAFFYVPNGVNMAHWRPSDTGLLKDLPKTLNALSPYRDQWSGLGRRCRRPRPRPG